MSMSGHRIKVVASRWWLCCCISTYEFETQLQYHLQPSSPAFAGV
jgi:hypothetical protein